MDKKLLQTANLRVDMANGKLGHVVHISLLPFDVNVMLTSLLRNLF